MQIHRRTIVVDGLATSYLEAGEGDPVVLLHGGEFGASAELGWERNIAALAARYRVLAPDSWASAQSAKVVDFVDGRGMRIRHVARFCEVLGIDSAHFVGNSMGAINLLTDATSDAPLLPVRSLAIICGGGEIQQNRHFEALQQYDATLPAMRRIVEALFYDAGYPADDDYVRRRYESSIAPGAWEAVAAARFRRPGCRAVPPPRQARGPMNASRCRRLSSKGRGDKLLPPGWAAQIAKQIAGRPLGGGRRRRPLPPDRTAATCQRVAAGLLRPVGTGAQSGRWLSRRSEDVVEDVFGPSRPLGDSCCGSASPRCRGCRRPGRRGASAWAAR